MDQSDRPVAPARATRDSRSRPDRPAEQSWTDRWYRAGPSRRRRDRRARARRHSASSAASIRRMRSRPAHRPPGASARSLRAFERVFDVVGAEARHWRSRARPHRGPRPPSRVPSRWRGGGLFQHHRDRLGARHGTGRHLHRAHQDNLLWTTSPNGMSQISSMNPWPSCSLKRKHPAVSCYAAMHNDTIPQDCHATMLDARSCASPTRASKGQTFEQMHVLLVLEQRAVETRQRAGRIGAQILRRQILGQQELQPVRAPPGRGFFFSPGVSRIPRRRSGQRSAHERTGLDARKMHRHDPGQHRLVGGSGYSGRSSGAGRRRAAPSRCSR